uniref:Uncharacterized protein n=1 Tax=Anguilla anguilla TaxID=7936 RepID=A0A0E9V0Y7_ANGAN
MVYVTGTKEKTGEINIYDVRYITFHCNNLLDTDVRRPQEYKNVVSPKWYRGPFIITKCNVKPRRQ